MLILKLFLSFLYWENSLKINITPYGENIFDNFLPLKNYGNDFQFSGNNGKIKSKALTIQGRLYALKGWKTNL